MKSRFGMLPIGPQAVNLTINIKKMNSLKEETPRVLCVHRRVSISSLRDEKA